MSQQRRNARPTQQNTQLSKRAINSVSGIRKAQISLSANPKEESNSNSPHIHASIAHSPNFAKRATVGSPTLPTSSSSTERMLPEIYSPLFQISNLNLPRDRVTMNAWNRIFYDTHPLVRNAINLHASYPISKININCKSKKVQQFFMDMAERIDLYSIVYGVALEFWKNGEAFPYAELDKSSGAWKRITIQNPDYIHVRKSVIGDQVQISLRPDAGLQRIVSSNSPADLQLKRRIPKEILDYVKKGQNIPLDPFNISHLKLLSSPYDIRGTSIIVSVYKDMIHYDKLRECKYAQADGMVNPLTLVKLTGDEGYKPGPADLEAFRTTLEEAQYDKDFKIITHGGVEIQRVGFTGQVLDVGPDFEFILNNIYAGLMVPKALIQQESVTYASSSIGLEVLRQRYDIFRNMIKKWLEKKIFAPICELQDFFEYVDGEKRLEIPSIDFNHMNLYDMNDYISSLGNYVGQKQISLQSLYRSLGLSYDEEKRRLREERVDFVIAEKELAALQAMRLAELKSLDPEQDIPESDQPAIPGAPGAGGPGIPGVGGAELGGLGLPPLPSGGPLGGGGGGGALPPPLPAGGGPGGPGGGGPAGGGGPEGGPA